MSIEPNDGPGQNAACATLIAQREARHNDVHVDAQGRLAVGIGHVVVPADGLLAGDVISDERVDALFAADITEALRAAQSQATEARITDAAFLLALAAVNFQLGGHWRRALPHTWQMITDGNYDDAAEALNGTLWARQTPERVKDFQDALGRLPSRR
jgi:GH24 family phage-related lysozyme (muramidase)